MTRQVIDTVLLKVDKSVFMNYFLAICRKKKEFSYQEEVYSCQKCISVEWYTNLLYLVYFKAFKYLFQHKKYAMNTM